MIFKFHPAPWQKLNTCAFSPLRLPVMLPLHRWQSNHHEFRRHHMVSRADPDTDVQTCFFYLSPISVFNPALSAPVHCGTSRRVSRLQFSRATAATSWVCPCRPTSAPLCQEPATLRSNCGTSGTACAGRPSQATSRTSTPSVWVCSGQRQGAEYVAPPILLSNGITV